MRKIIYILFTLLLVGCTVTLLNIKNSEEVDIEGTIKLNTEIDSLNVLDTSKHKTKKQ